MNKTTKLAVGIGGGLLALGLGLGMATAAYADPSTPPTPGQGQPGYGQGRMGQGMAVGMRQGTAPQAGVGMRNGARYGTQTQAAYLAEKLGKPVADVQKALDAYRASHTPGTMGPDMTAEQRAAEHQAVAAYLAKELNVSEATVLAALDGMDDARQATRTAEVTQRLNEAVKAGKITQAQADAAAAAHEAGGMGKGRR